MTTSKPAIKPPENLPKTAKKLWESVVLTYELEPHHLQLLASACVQLARAVEAREVLAKDGLTVVNRFNELKEHPLLAVERSSSLAFQRLLRELGLDTEEVSALRSYRRPGTRN